MLLWLLYRFHRCWGYVSWGGIWCWLWIIFNPFHSNCMRSWSIFVFSEKSIKVARGREDCWSWGMLTFNEMLMIFQFSFTGWAQWIMMVLLLKEKGIQGKPAINKFPQSMLIGWVKALQMHNLGTSLYWIAVTICPVEFVAKVFTVILSHCSSSHASCEFAGDYLTIDVKMVFGSRESWWRLRGAWVAMVRKCNVG